MSIDSIGRVIVGSGHFIERAPQIVEASSRLVVGAGHFADLSARVPTLGDRMTEFSDGLTRSGRQLDEFFYSFIKHSDKHERAKQQAEDNLKNLGEAGKDLLEMIGWARAGDAEEAQRKALDASQRMTDVFLNPPTGNK